MEPDTQEHNRKQQQMLLEQSRLTEALCKQRMTTVVEASSEAWTDVIEAARRGLLQAVQKANEA